MSDEKRKEIMESFRRRVNDKYTSATEVAERYRTETDEQILNRIIRLKSGFGWFGPEAARVYCQRFLEIAADDGEREQFMRLKSILDAAEEKGLI